MSGKRTQIQELPWLLTRGRMTWAIGAAILIIILYIVQWVIGYFHPGVIERCCGLTRSGLFYGCLWQPVSYLFVHHLSHPFGLCFSIFGLMVFGSETEGIIGAKHFALLFLSSGIVAGVAYLLVARSGLLLGAEPAACAIIVGSSTILSEFPVSLPFRSPLCYKHVGWTLVLILLSYALLSGRAEATSTALVNLSGAVAGWMYVRILGFGSPLPGEMVFRRRLAERARAKRLPVRLYLAAYVDPILEKIHREGIRSLSRAEKQILRQARQKVLLKVS